MKPLTLAERIFEREQLARDRMAERRMELEARRIRVVREYYNSSLKELLFLCACIIVWAGIIWVVLAAFEN